MTEQDLRIVYMGTPEFAVAPLQKLVDSGYNVVAVITAPDKPAGRGKKLSFSPVKKYALDHQLILIQPEKLRDPGFIAELKSLKPDIQVVVAFRMLPEMVWSIPALGTFNLHASLLPDYRGAAPINRAIINGEKETGLTTFFINKDIDTGHILLQKKFHIGEKENAGMLHDRLMAEGADMVVETIRRIAAGSIDPLPQEALIREGATLHPAPKITKEDCRIDWHQGSITIFNFIRGMSPFPGAYSYLVMGNEENKLFKILEADYVLESHQNPPGTAMTDHRSKLWIASTDGWISVGKLQQAGKRIMDTGEFLRGFSFNSSSYLFS